MTAVTHLIYFSPTRTTKKIVEQIAVGLDTGRIEHHDLTLAESGINRSIDDGVAVIGIPVYAGRVPEVCLQRMEELSSSGRPAVLVALYGNREFEDALVELRDVVLAKGFSVVAAGAFIGEHSYSTAEQPIAANRPDTADLQQALKFGVAIAEKLQAASPAETPQIPGEVPYKERVPLGGVAPVTISERCTLCGTCAEGCPEQARQMGHPRVQERRDLLIQHCSQRKEPVIFI